MAKDQKPSGCWLLAVSCWFLAVGFNTPNVNEKMELNRNGILAKDQSRLAVGF